MRNHTTDGTGEDTGRSTVVEWTALLWVDQMAFVHEVVEFDLVTESVTGDVDQITSDDGNVLSVKDFLSDDGGQATHQVALAIHEVRLACLKTHL